MQSVNSQDGLKIPADLDEMHNKYMDKIKNIDRKID